MQADITHRIQNSPAHSLLLRPPLSKSMRFYRLAALYMALENATSRGTALLRGVSLPPLCSPCAFLRCISCRSAPIHLCAKGLENEHRHRTDIQGLQLAFWFRSGFCCGPMKASALPLHRQVRGCLREQRLPRFALQVVQQGGIFFAALCGQHSI